MTTNLQTSLVADNRNIYPPITKQEAARTLLDRRKMRASLSPFIKKTFETVDPGTAYKHNWHIDCIAEYLEACVKRQIKRLIINIAPRHLKSICTSVALPAWAIGNDPSEQIMAASYSASLAIKHSVDCRLVMQSPWYKQTFPGVDLVADMNMKSEFVTTKRGHRVAVGVGGSATGKGGNILLVDDPVDPLQALSDEKRETCNTWFDQTYSTRFNDEKEGVMIVIMQRLHQNDLVGHILGGEDAENWEHLNIQQEPPTPIVYSFGNFRYEREAEELIHPERMGKAENDKKKKAIGSYAYAGQYQQEPSPLSGGLIDIKWFRRYSVLPNKFKCIVQSWDTAGKEKDINDPSVCTTWGVTEDSYYLIDAFRDRLIYPDLKKAVVGRFLKYAPSVVLIEDKSSGESLIQDIRDGDLKEYKIPVKPIMPTTDKVTRMSVESPVIEAGYVYLPKQAGWLPDFELELRNFPNSATKDQVDSVSQFLKWTKRKPAKPNVRSL